MAERTEAPDFATFSASLKATHLPGTDDDRFLRDLYAAVGTYWHFVNESQDRARQLAEDIRPRIKKCDRVLRTIRGLQRECAEVEGDTEKVIGTTLNQKSLFSGIRDALDQISSSVEQSRQMAVDQMHPSFVRKSGKAKWDLFLKCYDYPFKTLGWKEPESNFTDWVSFLAASKFGSGEGKISKKQRLELIKEILIAGLGRRKDLKAIEMHIRRHRPN